MNIIKQKRLYQVCDKEDNVLFVGTAPEVAEFTNRKDVNGVYRLATRTMNDEPRGYNVYSSGNIVYTAYIGGVIMWTGTIKELKKQWKLTYKQAQGRVEMFGVSCKTNPHRELEREYEYDWREE